MRKTSLECTEFYGLIPIFVLDIGGEVLVQCPCVLPIEVLLLQQQGVVQGEMP